MSFMLLKTIIIAMLICGGVWAIWKGVRVK